MTNDERGVNLLSRYIIIIIGHMYYTKTCVPMRIKDRPVGMRGREAKQ